MQKKIIFGCSLYNLDIPESFEFTKYEDGYFCVVPEAHKYKGVLEKLEPAKISYLPLDFAIIFLEGVVFLGDPPKLISIQEANQKLSEIREKILVLNNCKYKLAWIGGKHGVDLCYMDDEMVLHIIKNVHISWLETGNCKIDHGS